MIKFFDQTRALYRLLVQGSERGTISEQAKVISLAARQERAEANRQMDALLADLVHQRKANGAPRAAAVHR